MACREVCSPPQDVPRASRSVPDANFPYIVGRDSGLQAQSSSRVLAKLRSPRLASHWITPARRKSAEGNPIAAQRIRRPPTSVGLFSIENQNGGVSGLKSGSPVPQAPAVLSTKRKLEISPATFLCPVPRAIGHFDESRKGSELLLQLRRQFCTGVRGSVPSFRFPLLMRNFFPSTDTS